ncbi:hypothetical protein RB195_019591 [Necator americanus]|uniref:Uncharacterized protein n=1 Tax=Necator americanus TaxID=51031 RepID=A0ABR1CH41_NECAM
MNQRTTAAVRTPAGCTTLFQELTGVRQELLAGPFLLNFAIDDIMRRTVDQCPADIILAQSGHPISSTLTMLIYSRKAVRNFNMLSTLYRSWLQLIDYVYALLNASRCGSFRDLERESEWVNNQSNSSMSSVTWAVC